MHNTPSSPSSLFLAGIRIDPFFFFSLFFFFNSEDYAHNKTNIWQNCPMSACCIVRFLKEIRRRKEKKKGGGGGGGGGAM